MPVLGPAEGRVSRSFELLRKVACRGWGPALWLLLFVSAGACAVALWTYFDAQRHNSIVSRLAGGEDVAIETASAPDAVLLGRANYLLFRERIDEAQTIADLSAARMAPATRSKLLYNLGNARLRTAIAAIEQGALDKAIASVNLAKIAYRQALRIDPAAWDVKYNLDVAMRLVRDLPQQDDVDEEGATEEPKQLWTDLPGVPKGLP